MPGKETELKKEEQKKQPEIRTDANQQAEVQAPQKELVQQNVNANANQIQQQDEAIGLEKFNEKMVIENHHAFDQLYDDTFSLLQKDRYQPGGGMEAADYLDLQGSQMLEKLQACDRQYKKDRYSHVVGHEKEGQKKQFSFESFILTKELQEAMRNLDLTDQKKVNALKKQIRKSIENCEHITGPALKAMSDKFFKYAYTSSNQYFANVNSDRRFLVTVLRFMGNRHVAAGVPEHPKEKDSYILNQNDVDAAMAADKKILGGESALKEEQTVDELRLVDDQKLSARENKEKLGSLYRKGIGNLTEKEKKKLNGMTGKVFRWTYQWDPSLMLYEAQKDPSEKVPGKDGELVPRQLDLYRNQTDLLTFADTLTERMLQQIADYCTVRYDLSQEPASKMMLVNALKKTLGDSRDFASIKSISGEFITGKKDLMTGKDGLDVSVFTNSAAVQQMNSLCGFIRNYAEKVNEQNFYSGLMVKDRIFELQKMTEQSRTSVKEAFDQLRKDVDQVLKANFAEGEIPVDKNDTDLQRMEKELGGLSGKNLDQPKYEMSYQNLYSMNLTFRDSLNRTIGEREYEVEEKGKKVTKKKEVIDISTETFTELRESYKKIELTMKRIVESYKQEKHVEGTLEDALRGTGEEWAELVNEPLWSSYRLVYSSYQHAVDVAARFRSDLEKHGAMKDNMISGYYGNVKDVRRMLERCEKKLDASAMNASVAAEYERVQELQKEYSELRKSLSGTDKAATERDKISEGKKVYEALAKYDALRTDLASKKKNYLTKSPQGRQVIQMVNDMKMDYCAKLLDEKKEELAYYEGSLLKREMQLLRNQEQQKQPENKNLTQAEQIADAIAAYKKIKSSLDAYLGRYGDLKESCYYVKDFELRKEHYIRKIKDQADAMVVSVCDQVTEEMELDKKLEKPVFDESFGRTIREMAQVKQKECTQEEVNACLDEWFHLTLASRSLDMAGMKADEILQRLGYESGFQDDGEEISIPKRVKMAVPIKQLREWYKGKAAKLLPLCKEMEKKFREKTGNASEIFSKIDFEMNFEDYLMRQTKLGAQVHALVGMAGALHIGDLEDEEKFGELAELDFINFRMSQSRDAAAAYFNMEKDNKELYDRQAVETYRDLKRENNLETKNEALRKRYFAQRDEADASEDPKISVKKALEQLKAKDLLIEKNSKYFQDVMDAALALEACEKSKTASYSDMQKAYELVQKTAEIYIRKRDNWNHAFRDIGKQRLNAVKDLKDAIEPRFAMLEGFRKSDHTYEDRKAYIEGQVQKLRTFRNELERTGEEHADRNFLIRFRTEFAKDLKAFDEDTLTSTRAGVDYMVELKDEELKLSRLTTKYLLSKSEDLIKKCLQNEPASLPKEKQYELWAECYSFYSENKKFCPAEAEHSLQTVEMLSKRFMDAREFKAIKDNIQADEKLAAAYAQGKDVNVADMLRLRFKHKKFLKGVGKIKMGSAIPGYDVFVQNMQVIGERTRNALTTETAPGLMAKAQKLLDEKLETLRKELGDHDFIGNAAGAEVTEKIRDGLHEIAFLTETFGFLKNIKKYKKDDLRREEKAAEYAVVFEYYERQRQSLERILASYAVRDVVVDDLDFDYKKESKKDHTLSKGYGTISKVKLVDKRLADLEEDAERLEDADVDLLTSYISYAASVEAETKQMGGLKHLSQNQPEMAEELKRQMTVRTKFEAYLKRLEEKKAAEKEAAKKKAAAPVQPESQRYQERLQQAFDNLAVKYSKKLEKKLKTIADYHLDSSQERMLCYVTSLSKSFDEAQEFLKLVRDWERNNGLQVGQTAAFTRLQNAVNDITRQSAEGLRQDGFEAVAKQLRRRVQDLKTEDAMMRYSTEQVCKMRDGNFGMTLRELGSLKLSGVNDLHVNEKVKAERLHYDAEGYDKLKINKSWSFKVFGYTLWGKDNYSLDDFIGRIEKAVDLYENDFLLERERNALKPGEKLRTPLRDLLGDMNTVKTMAERLSRPEEVPEGERTTLVTSFKGLIRNLDHKFTEACLAVTGLPPEEDILIDNKTGKWINKKTKEDISKVHEKAVKQVKSWQKGWKDYYVILNTLPEQVESYFDRLPWSKEKIQNYKTRSDHKCFMDVMGRLTEVLAGNAGEDVKEDQLVEALGFARMCTNAYAESALEHNVNMECTTYSEYLAAMVENRCFQHAQKTMDRIREMRPEDRLKDAGEVYTAHIRYISKFYLATGLGRDGFKQMKKNMDLQMKRMGLGELVVKPDGLKELQESVLQEMLDNIKIPEVVEGDKNSRLDNHITEEYKAVKSLFGAMLMRSLAIDDTEELAAHMAKTGEDFRKAAEKVNGKSWWRIICNMIGRIIPL